ncbi:AI-2E family transporter [Pseudodesulfovibrio tunisiensis]|uniref:AI-2E family transporter n=1 Tax=Pseudodesulfovibrio tunisiensis TaxID=463192 RepID=UPI001FB1F237|nr:AI-2E family transporter [Pseudodesulfovibrio tunisiensis]
MSLQTPSTLDRVARIFLWAVLVLGLLWLLQQLSDVLLPFAAALALAYMLNPLVSLVQRGVKSRGAAVGLTLVGVVGGLGATLWLVVPVMGREFARMGALLKGLVGNSELARKAAASLPPDLWEWLRELVQRPEVQEFFSDQGFVKLAETTAKKVLPGVWGVISGTADVVLGLVVIFVVLLYLVFLLADFGRIRSGWKDYLPERYRDATVEFANEFLDTMNRYFRSQFLIAMLTGILLATGFALIGLPLGIVLGLGIGLLNIAPYLSTIGILPVAFLGAVNALEAGHSVWLGMGLALGVMAAVQVIQDGFLVPRIQGRSMGLSPWMILLSLSLWGKLLGFLGLILALPMTCLCLAYYRRWLDSAGSRPKPTE